MDIEINNDVIVKILETHKIKVNQDVIMAFILGSSYIWSAIDLLVRQEKEREKC